jgi:hypothetical protein
MALEEAIDILEILVPIAKAVPIPGARVEGSLEVLKKIIELARVRYCSPNLWLLYQLNHNPESQGQQEQNGGAGPSSRSLAEHRRRDADRAQARSGSRRARGLAVQYCRDS